MAKDEKKLDQRVYKGPAIPVRDKSQVTEKFSIAIVEIVAADTEYVWEIPKGLSRFTLHCRDGTALRLAFKEGIVATPSSNQYFTLTANSSWDEDNLNIAGSERMYFACDSASKVVEIIVGVKDIDAD